MYYALVFNPTRKKYTAIKRKGNAPLPSLKQIREYSKLTPRQRLDWLEEANKFSQNAVKGNRKVLWEAFRKGEI